MELGIYLLTTVLCIAWSIKLYNDWFFSAHFNEGDVLRVFLLILPGSFFLVSLLSTWVLSETFRLDILVLVVYDVIILVSFLTEIISKKIAGKRTGFLIGLSVFSLLSITLIVFTFLIRKFPLLLMKITFYLNQIGSFKFIENILFSFEPESESEAMVSLVNKAVIAFFSYLPVTIIRFLYFRRSQQRLRNEVKELRKRIKTIEGIVNHE